MATRVKPPLPIRILSYDKVVKWDELPQEEWLFVVQNGVIIDGDLYLTSYVNTASESYRKIYW